MKKIMCFFILLSNIFVNKNVNSSVNQYVNKSYILLDASNNEMLEGKDVHLVRSVASVSKIMTAIIAIESGDLDSEVTITKEDIDTYGSSIYLKEGNKVKLLDLIYGLMLRSGNDAAKAIARSVGKDLNTFIEMMNIKAKNIGMKNTIFNNPSGLDVEEAGNLSTSYDLALLMSYAIKNEKFLEISSTKEYKSEIGTWVNKNKLLRSYNKTIAGKTGFTYKAKRTLVTAARDGDNTFVAVTLDCGNDFNFHKYLYEKNFQKYKGITLLKEGDNYIENYRISCSQSLHVTVDKQDMEEYSVIYNIKEDKTKVYLNYKGDVRLVGICDFKEEKNNKTQKSVIDKIKDFFNK